MGCTHCVCQKECHISSIDLVLLCMLAVTVQEPALGRVVLELLRGRFECDMAHLGSLYRRLLILSTNSPLSMGMGAACLSCQIA